ncbi:MAG TPA: hypothetical protein VKV80_03615 [Streptosporangiaceae bacterium]|nr:hypothetical protein [Streptosporangiaceae bacterium]
MGATAGGLAATVPLLGAGCLGKYINTFPEDLTSYGVDNLVSGSQVLAYRIPYGYSSPGPGLAMHVEAAVERLPAGEPELMVFYGVGNHGGGPARANLGSIRRLDAAGAGRRLRCSSPGAFFDSLMASGRKIPVHCGELRHHAAGCCSPRRRTTPRAER